MDRNAISFDFIEGQPSVAQTVTVTTQGTYVGTVYAGVNVSGTVIDPNMGASFAGPKATFSIKPLGNLVAGSYSGTLYLRGCADNLCSQDLGNSPLSVSYQITVRPTLKVTPASIIATVTSGASVTRTISVQLPYGQSSYGTSIINGSPWIRVSNGTANSFDVVLASMPSGTYVGSIQVTSGNMQSSIPVNYTVNAPAGGNRYLAASAANLALTTSEGATTSTNILVTPPSWNSAVTASVEYPTSSATSWLSTSSIANGYQVLADAGHLSAGTYSATIRLKGAFPSTDVTVPVALTVRVGLVKPNDVSVQINAETSAGALSGSVNVGTMDGQIINWTATSDAAWLVLNKSAGSVGESINYSVDAAKVNVLTNAANYVANVTIAPSINTMTPVSFKLNLFKNLPQVTNVGPYVNLAGKPLRLNVRGSGFASITNINARFSLQGGTISNISRVNDTEVVLNVGAMVVGKYAISASNQLNLSSSAASLTIVNEPAFGYSVMPTGAVKYLIYDPERAALYGANQSAEQLVRYRNIGASWLVDSISLTKAFDVGLSQDGTQIIAVGGAYNINGSIHLIDPQSLAELSVTSLNAPLGLSFIDLGFGIQTTNDGRSLFALGSGWNLPMYFRTDTLTTSPLINESDRSLSFYYGPWYAVSRNGERVLIEPNNSPGMLYMDAADSIVKINPAGLGVSNQFAMSEDGSRVMFDNYEVRDGSFGLIGRIQLPSGNGSIAYYARTGLMSPDGSRVFILAYAANAYEWITTITPRIFVFDSSTSQVAQTNLSMLGYFDIPDYPACIPASSGTDACSSKSNVISGAINLSGNTLFFIGNKNFIVAPVPSTLQQ